MKKRLLSLLLVLSFLITSVGVMAEGFARVEKVELVDGAIEVSFSNGIFRSFEESKEEVKLLGDQEEEKFTIEVKDEGKGKEKSKTFLVTIEEIVDGKNYSLLIGKNFKVNNGRNLEEDYIVNLDSLNGPEEETKEEVKEDTIKKEEKPEKKEEIKTPFLDIEGNKAERQIARLYKKGLVSGKTETEYRPNENILFVEGISIINRYLKLEEVLELEEFTSKAWYREDALKALKKGLIVEEDLKRLEETITMKELSDILFNIRDEFNLDAENLEGARDQVREILSKNYDENTRVEGRKELTRGDFATIFGNLMKK